MNNPILDSSTGRAATKKRLNKLFKDQNKEFILIWASLKSSRQANPRSTLKPRELTELPSSSLINVQSDRRESAENLRGTHKLTHLTIPRTALNNYCLNVNLPVIGCAIVLLSLTSTVNLPEFSLEQRFELPQSREKCFKRALPSGDLLEQARGPKEPALWAPCSHTSFDSLMRTHQVAEFIEQLSVSKAQGLDKWHSNLLLGAFLPKKNTLESIFFISSSEIKQTILLQQSLKKGFRHTTYDLLKTKKIGAQDLGGKPFELLCSPQIVHKEILQKTFEETISRLSRAYKAQVKIITSLLQNLILKINRPQTKLVRIVSRGRLPGVYTT